MQDQLHHGAPAMTELLLDLRKNCALLSHVKWSLAGKSCEPRDSISIMIAEELINKSVRRNATWGGLAARQWACFTTNVDEKASQREMVLSTLAVAPHH